MSSYVHLTLYPRQHQKVLIQKYQASELSKQSVWFAFPNAEAMFANKWWLQCAFSLSFVAPRHQVDTVNSFHNAGTYSHVIFHALQTVTGTAFYKRTRVIKNSSVHCISQYVTRCKSVCIKISFFCAFWVRKEENKKLRSMFDVRQENILPLLFVFYFLLCPVHGFTSQNIQSSFPDIFSVRKCFTKIKFARNVLPRLVAWTVAEYEYRLGRVSVYKNWATYWDIVRQRLKWNLQHAPKIIEGGGEYPCQSLNQSNNIGWT